MHNTNYTLLIVVFTLLVFFGQSAAAYASLPCDLVPENSHSTSTNAEHVDLEEDDCCDTDCCEADCLCLSHACSGIIYLYITATQSLSPLTTVGIETERNEVPRSLPSTRYRPPIVIS
jgi:hypothetical protein